MEPIAATARAGDLLWVDDDLTTLDAGARLLALEGFGLDFAITSREGVAKVRSRSYDGVILDLLLPDGSGLDVLRSLRQVESSTRVSILSGHIALKDAVMAGRLDVLEVISKPCFGDDLVAMALRLTAGASCRKRDLRWVISLLEFEPAGRPSTPLDRVLADALLASSLSIVDWLAVSRAVRPTNQGDSALAVLNAALRTSLNLDAMGRRTRERTEAGLGVEPAIGLCHLSRSCGLTERKLSKAIRAACGASYAHLRVAHRVRSSMELLIHSAEQVAQIAYFARYAWPTQFDRDFRLIFQMTPSDFRKRFCLI